MFHLIRFLREITATLFSIALPRSVTRHLLKQTDHFAPHPGTGFEGWYTRIQDKDVSIAIILCSLSGDSDVNLKRRHYLHFSIVPLVDNASMKKPLEINLFPQRIIPDSSKIGSLPFSLVVPDIGTFVCDIDEQTYDLRIPDKSSGYVYYVNVRLTGRTPLDISDSLRTPHGSFARLEHTLPLHWGIFSTHSEAQYNIRRSRIISNDGTDEEDEILKGVGRAHMEKNWGVSFPDGWTWSQASSASSETPVSLALAGGMILGNKAFMIHYRSLKNTWTFLPPCTIVLAFPRLLSALLRNVTHNRPGSSLFQSSRPFSQWGPFTREAFDNTNGVLQVEVQSLRRKLSILVQATEIPTSDSWLELYCPLPGGHSTAAYETFTGIMNIRCYTRQWPFGSWKLVEEHVIPDAALEFGGTYWSKGDQVEPEY